MIFKLYMRQICYIQCLSKRSLWDKSRVLESNQGEVIAQLSMRNELYVNKLYGDVMVKILRSLVVCICMWVPLHTS